MKIVRVLNINKTHGHDEISIRMIKICDEALVKPLSLIYKNCIDTGVFPDIWKKSNIVPVYKRGDKQIIDNYRPISLLPICGKILEKILLNLIYEFLEENNLLWMNISQDSDLQILVNISYFQLYMTFRHLLTVVHFLMLEVSFWIYLKLLIEYGIIDLFIK